MILTCIGIFFARILDVTFGTLRTVYTVKGKQFIAAFIAFIEVLIWFVVARQALCGPLKHPVLIAISYSAGYATGTMIGTIISNLFVNGFVMLQAIIKKDDKKLIKEIRNAGYGLSIVPLKHELDETAKEMLIIETNKKNSKNVIDIIKTSYPDAFIMINETKAIHNGLLK